ncbi:MAG: alpha-1,6-mannanase [Bacteroidales bacterium]|nr:alpha-1,6-mannanase [Bacteroidales bacterium]
MKAQGNVSLILFLLFFAFTGCEKKSDRFGNCEVFLGYAETTLHAIYDKYGVANENLLRENYPFDEDYTATYLDDSDAGPSNKYSFLWPYSGMFSAANALYGLTRDSKFLEMIEDKVLPGLEEYFDTERHPFAYSSYITRAPLSDRYYDDNIWIGIDFVDLYLMTSDPVYLDKAQTVWYFLSSGLDEKLGGGIYWVEQNKASKNACSNAPAAVFALKLYLATKDDKFLKLATDLYHWTKEHLQDKEDLLYYDNIRLDGSVDKKKYSYNSGQMLQAAALLYNITKDETYLVEAEGLADSCHKRFFHDFNEETSSFKIPNGGDVWFTAVMCRGFLELYQINKEVTYINSIIRSLKHAWNHMQDENGLFGTDWEGKDDQTVKWLLTQAAMVEMYAKFANPDSNNNS